MEELTIARRYAKGLLNIIKDNKKLERYIYSFRRFWKKFKKGRDKRFILYFDMIELNKRVSLLKPLISEFEDIQKRFIQYLNLKGRFTILPIICDEMERMMYERMDIVLVESISARKIDTDILMDLIGVISAKVGKRIKLKENIDTRRIGGIMLKIGDIVLDGTIDGRLRRLREEIG
ncbi:MAG: ATP synthase F1 subunit delta [bacterium]